MKLNPKTCKGMVINFMKNPNSLLSPIVVEGTTIQGVTSYKLLGVFIDDDLKRNTMLNIFTRKHVRDCIL